MTKLLKTVLIIGFLSVFSFPLFAETGTTATTDKEAETLTSTTTDKEAETLLVDEETDKTVDEEVVEDADEPEGYTAVNSRHNHRLGGKSRHAWRGLSRAADRSRAITKRGSAGKK